MSTLQASKRTMPLLSIHMSPWPQKVRSDSCSWPTGLLLKSGVHVRLLLESSVVLVAHALS